MKLDEATPAAGRRGRKPIDRRAQILDAAEGLYASLGTQKTTVGDIARALGMSAANLYRHFPNRHAIDEALARRKLTAIEDAAWRAARKASRNPSSALRELIFSVMEVTDSMLFSEEKLHELCVIATEQKWPVVDQFMRDLQGAVRHVLIEGRNSGHFAVDDLERVTGAVFWTLLRVWHPQMLSLYRNQDLPGVAEDLCALILRSLREE